MTGLTYPRRFLVAEESCLFRAEPLDSRLVGTTHFVEAVQVDSRASHDRSPVEF